MKFYILVMVFAVAFAKDSSSSSSSSEAETETEAENVDSTSEELIQLERRYEIVREKQREYIKAAIRIKMIIGDSSMSYEERVAVAHEIIDKQDPSIQKMLRDDIWPYLEENVNRVRTRGRRNIGHGVQPNHHEPRPGNYNPYGNANERPHGGNHGGHGGHNHGQRGHHHM